MASFFSDVFALYCLWFANLLSVLASADTAVFCQYQLGYLSIVLVGTIDVY
jgi:hypothetical protein